MGKLGGRLKVVRPRHPNSSKLKRTCFKTQLARQMLAVLKERNIKRGKRLIRNWVSDEARFGLQPFLRRAWVSRGVSRAAMTGNTSGERFRLEAVEANFSIPIEIGSHGMSFWRPLRFG